MCIHVTSCPLLKSVTVGLSCFLVFLSVAESLLPFPYPCACDLHSCATVIIIKAMRSNNIKYSCDNQTYNFFMYKKVFQNSSMVQSELHVVILRIIYMYFSKSLAIYRNKGVQDKNLIMNGKIRSTDKCMKLVKS